jgi:threonylcarbamoyladenosine tRNA methylthiotransferase MtaB
MKTVKFFTLGCKVNQYETQVIREKFIHAGFQELEDSQTADIYIINTCTVTQTADQKSCHFIHYAHRENPSAKIIVTGCYAELDSNKIVNISGVTHIVKNKEKYKILELLNEPNENNEIGITNFSGHTRAFLKIQDGCNNHCSYCKVPKVRGASRSRPLDDIVQEAEGLVSNGFKEIVLCGICLGSYGRDLAGSPDLVDVIENLENIEGLLRIRLSSIEAGDISDRLIQKMAQSLPGRQAGKKLCPHLHIPMQSGDDEILKKMNRKYTKNDYLGLINRIKRSIPDIAITTDVMVGFPGESGINFKNTVDLIQEIQPLKVHIFPYSKRKGTLAAINFKEELDYKIIKERLNYLKNIAAECALTFKKQFLNKVMDVLIETRLKDKSEFWDGHTDNYIKVMVKSGISLKNQLIKVRLAEILEDAVLADLC